MTGYKRRGRSAWQTAKGTAWSPAPPFKEIGMGMSEEGRGANASS